MGHVHSTERQLFVAMVKTLLKSRNISITTKQVGGFLEFIDTVCPWFPNKGTINLETWNKVGENIKSYYAANGPDKIPIDAFPLWTLIKECLQGDTEYDKWQRQTRPRSRSADSGLKPSAVTNPDSQPSAPPEYPSIINNEQKDIQESNFKNPFLMYSNTGGKKCRPLKQSKSALRPIELSEELSSDEEVELEKEAAQYHNEDDQVFVNTPFKLKKQQTLLKKEPVVLPAIEAGRRPPPPDIYHQISPHSPLQLSLLQAKQQGEDVSGFSKILHAYPITYAPHPTQANVRIATYTSITFKNLKELKTAAAQYGATAPYTIAILETIAAEVLPPWDWKGLAKATLMGGEYLLWLTDFMDSCYDYSQKPHFRQQGITHEMLAGTGPHVDLAQQLTYPAATYDAIREIGLKAWKGLPRHGTSREELTKVRQGPDEPYHDFVSRLLQTSSRLIQDTDSAMILVKELAFENANNICQSILRPWKNKSTLNDYIRLCSDVSSGYIQGIVTAAAQQGKPVEQVLAAMQFKKNRRVAGPPGSCFHCGQMGHQVRQCPNKKIPSNNGKNPGLCPKCKKGNHWANECRSKYDKNGNSLQSGNFSMGLPRAHPNKQGMYPVQVQTSEHQLNNPFHNSTEPPVIVPDWTCVPPPTSY
ncbi:endogenous retrovirus group K member 5 Gag polyprotein-like [Colius striatus]|uniref:endogenous retrovirus group K member 5 Gag polyprotein-like n=1 Tax=Colius striatus TaxID=57412 RepID=UPI002B1D8618|nr:endogenous retrovirus group K member 5 Gag polyprotein-like [Colius striatus]